MLALDDYYILQYPLAQEIKQLLPLPATVDFCSVMVDGALQPLPACLSTHGGRAVGTYASFIEPKLINNALVIPLQNNSGENVAAVVSEVDPAFLKKMSASWLRELQGHIFDQLEKTRWGYIDPETELYNRRAATVFLQQSSFEDTGYFFLLNTVFYRRTAAGNLQKTKEIADLLQALTHCHCFSFGYGVFGLLKLHDL